MVCEIDYTLDIITDGNLLEKHNEGADEARDAYVGERHGQEQAYACRCEVEQHEGEHELPVGRRCAHEPNQWVRNRGENKGRDDA